MPTDHLMEGEDAVENDLESDCRQAGAKQTSGELSRNITESHESETEPPIPDKSVKLSNQRSSNRITKRTRKDQTPDVVLKKAVTVKQDTPSVRSKTRRPWELWSVEDKNAFFEALCEYGKDFENIQTYIAQRGKKKGVATNMIKNKDQVRHFYYRTWHKISKFLEISESVQKQTQELYGLINYGELRKKIGGCLNEKNRLKLNELVFSGVTTVKHKGKKLRIKTPVCRALKKLNNFTDAKEPESEKLPKEIVVEFRPCTNTAWLHVQTLAQNPRVRTKVCLQKRLRVVIEYLQKKWKPYRLKRKEQILNSLPNYNSEELICDIPPVLRVKPPRDVKIYPLTLSIIDTASSSDVCLEKYMKLSQKSLCKDVNKSKKTVNTKPKILSDKVIEISETVSEKTENAGEKCDMNTLTDTPDLCFRVNKSTDDNSYINLLTPPKSVPELDQFVEPNFTEMQRSFSSITSVVDSSAKFPLFHSDSLDKLSDSDHKSASKLVDGLEQNTQMNSDMLDSNASDCNNITLKLNNCANLNTKKDCLSAEKAEKDKHLSEKAEALKNKNSSDDNDDIYCRTVRQGWTVEEAGYLTFGELYLLLGKPPTILLEYEFEYPESTVTADRGTAPAANPISSELVHLLNKVLQVAQTYFADPRQKQLTGKQHGRGSSSKSKVKSSGLNEKASKDISSPQTNPTPNPVLSCKVVNNKNDVIPRSTTSSSVCQSSTTTTATVSKTTVTTASDTHVFVMPVGTPLRNVKHPNQNPLKEELGKLLPCTRRGCRVRRKPLVVQRPLLPREGMRPMTGPRPMTVVHLVPSVSPITTVIPPCSRPKTSIPAPKKVVKILPTGTSVDMHPIQVPVIKQLHPDSGQSMILQNSISSPHVIVNSSSESVHIINTPLVEVSSTSQSKSNTHSPPSQNIPSMSQVELNASADLNALNSNLLSGQNKSVIGSKDSFSSLSQLSLSDASNLISSVSSNFLDEFALASKNSDTSNLSSCLNLDISSKDFATSENSSQSFRINSSDFQWLNGESTDLSLNTLLNSIESPSKMSSGTAPNVTADDTNIDPNITLTPSALSLNLLSGHNKNVTESKDSFSSLSQISLSDASNLMPSVSPNFLDEFGLVSKNSEAPSLSSCLNLDISSSKDFTTSENSTPSFRINSSDLQWLNGESTELSLNTLLNSIESPSKMSSATTANMASENSNLDPMIRLAPIVDSQVRCLLDESSLDFITKFEDLAEGINNSSSSDSKQT